MVRFHETFLVSRLKLKQLQLLCVVAEKGNILRGSQALNIAQPAATKSIKDLEAMLGVTLFTRSARGVTPTEAGEVLIKHAKLVLAQLRHARQDLNTLEEGLSGHIKVGTLLAASPELLPRSIEILAEERPGVSVSVVEGTNDLLMPSLRCGDLDLVLGRLPAHRERSGLAQEVLYAEQVSVVVRKGHPLADLPNVDMQTLAEQKWILPPAQTSLRRQIEAAFRAENIEPPHHSIESISLLTNRTLLRSTDFVGIMPYPVADLYDELVHLPVEFDDIIGNVGITTRIESEPSIAARYFTEIVRRVGNSIQNRQANKSHQAISPTEADKVVEFSC